MAGYFKKLQGYVYDGEHRAKEKMADGIFAELDGEGLVVPATEAKDTVLRVAEKTGVFGEKGVLLDVVSVGAKEVFFVEMAYDDYGTENFDSAKAEIEAGELVRMKRPLPGEQIAMNLADDVLSGLKVGDKVTPTAKGTVVKSA